MESVWKELGDLVGGTSSSKKSKLIGEIDCTSPQSESICHDFGVQSYPTIKYGSIYNLQDYEGPRTNLAVLKSFVDQQLKPRCGLQHIQLCDRPTRKEIRRLQSLSLTELDAELLSMTETYNQISKDFESFVDDLEVQYAKAEKIKDKKLEDSGARSEKDSDLTKFLS